MTRVVIVDDDRHPLRALRINVAPRRRFALTLIYEDGRTDRCPRVLTGGRG